MTFSILGQQFPAYSKYDLNSLKMTQFICTGYCQQKTSLESFGKSSCDYRGYNNFLIITRLNKKTQKISHHQKIATLTIYDKRLFCFHLHNRVL